MIIVRLINLDDPANPECVAEYKVASFSVDTTEWTFGGRQAQIRSLRRHLRWTTSSSSCFHRIEIVREGDE